MPMQRHRTPATITTVPRSCLAHVHHKEVDAILKDLRFCSRRLKSTLDSFKDELHTLERLYYKCKNQHRMALFFKRVSEMRRYGRRVVELEIPERVDLLRASFVGLEHTSDQKALRNSWSHVPQLPYVYFLTERLTACSTLLCKMRERLEKAYHHFALAMQSGAFVQFIILFAAISSRLSVLSSQLDETLHFTMLTCNRLLHISHPTDAHATTSQRLSSEPEVPRPPHTDRDIPSEDTGQLVSRELIDSSSSVAENLSLKMETTLEIPPLDNPTNAVNHVAQASKRATVKAVQKPRLKKAKKRFDEIDEIFGF